MKLFEKTNILENYLGLKYHTKNSNEVPKTST